MIYNYYYALLLISFFPFYSIAINNNYISTDSTNSIEKPFITTTSKTKPSEIYEMTIFVHGTIKPPEISILDLIQIMRDKIDNTIYCNVIHHIRTDPELSNGQVMQGLGLKIINEKSHSTLQVLRHLYHYQFELLKKDINKNLLYTFGWNGLLSSSKRYKESEIFYEELHKELDRLATLNIHPKIKIITFSHGGNIALNMSIVKSKDTKPRKNDLIIDELIMLAVPVQSETDQQITSKFFKKVYHCYSNEDNIQTMDFFSSQKFFSKRFFKEPNNSKFPDTITQIQLRITKKIEGNINNNITSDTNEKYSILKSKKVRLIHKDPSHTEMWHFEWATDWYNKKFPLNPLPIVALLPTIIDIVNKHATHYGHIIFDYCPSISGALLKCYNKPSIQSAVPFLNKDAHKNLWDITRKFKPENFSTERQKEHIALALKKAQSDLEQEKTFQKPKNKTLAYYFEWAGSDIFNISPELKKFKKIHLLSTQF